MKEQLVSFMESELLCSYSKGIFLAAIPQNDNMFTHEVTIEFHEMNLVLNYVLSFSSVYNPLRKRVSNKCMGTHIYIKNFGRKGVPY